MKKKILVCLFLITLILLGIVLYLNQDKEYRGLKAYGNVDIRESSLAFEINGKINALFFDEGQKVTKGEILATLDTKALEHEKNIKLSSCNGLKAQLNLLENGYRKEEIDKAEAEVKALEKKLDVLLVEYKRHQAYTSNRLVQIFKHKRNKYIDFLFSSDDINDFLDRLYFENIIISYDKQKLHESKKCAKDIIALKNRIEMQKKNLEVAISNINRQQVTIQDAISKNEKLIEKLKTDRATWEKSERELARQSRAISHMINDTIKKEEKISGTVVTTGGFIRPVPGRITSPFGTRMHPIFKRKIFHSGVDIGAPYGTSIKASNSGRVIFVGWYSGYGKVVIIDHGKINGIPTTTLYAHMSVTKVSKGAHVAKGTIVGKVGTTGYSTGPHLHFEVRQKGNPVNPLKFIK